MVKIIENQGLRFNTIDIGNNTSVIDYLKNTNNGFILNHMDHKIFEAMQNNLMYPNWGSHQLIKDIQRKRSIN